MEVKTGEMFEGKKQIWSWCQEERVATGFKTP